MIASFPKPPSPAIVAHKITAQLARALPKVIKILPPPPFILQKKIGEKVLQQLMSEQIEMGDFDFLYDKWLQINVLDLDMSFYLSFADNQLIMSPTIAQADVIFSGDSKEFILLASRTEDPDTLFFQRRLVIEGDTELGLHIKNSIDGIDFDQWPHWIRQVITKIASIIEQDNSEQDEKIISNQYSSDTLATQN